MIRRLAASRPLLTPCALAAALWLGAAPASAADAPVPSLDADLLEQLTEGLDVSAPPKAGDKPADAAKPTDAPASKPAPPREQPTGDESIDEPATERKLTEPSRAGSSSDELNKNLLDELTNGTAPEGGEEDAIAMIRDRMEEARRKLDAAESGEEVQTLQKQIVDDLAKLLKLKQSQCQSQCSNPSTSSKPSSSSKPGSKPGQSSGKKPGDSKPNDAEQKPGDKQNQDGSPSDKENKKPADSDKSLRESKVAEAMAFDQLADFLQAEWGHLPERERNQVIQQFKEKFLPQYDQMIRDYYERLAAGRDESK